MRLCGHASPAEELSRKDDLTLLFMAVTSPCPAHNNAWRKSAGDVLTTLSRHGLTPNVVHYLHGVWLGLLGIRAERRVRVDVMVRPRIIRKL